MVRFDSREQSGMKKIIAAVFLAFLLLPHSASGEEHLFTLDEYRWHLQDMADYLEEGDRDTARWVALSLVQKEISHEGESFFSDSSILLPLINAEEDTDLGLLKARLAETIQRLLELESASPSEVEGERLSADLRLLGEIRLSQTPDAIPAGGRTGEIPVKPTSFASWLGERLLLVLEFLWEVLTDIIKAFWDFFGIGKEGAVAEESPGTSGLLVSMIVVVFALILLVLAWKVFWKSEGAPKEVIVPSDVELSSDPDADARSRTSTEWEDRAIQMQREGRHREAVRAWYHAALAVLFRTGVLRYRKGRTNWEYAYSLSPVHGWRQEFIQLTQTFEREWYGHHRTSPETVRLFEQGTREVLQQIRKAAA